MILNLNERKKEKHCLEVIFEEKKYNIPLGNYLTIKESNMIRTGEGMIDFLSSYLDKNVMDSLTVSDIANIANAWKDATKSDSGIEVGES